MNCEVPAAKELRRKVMGLVVGKIILKNLRKPELAPLEVDVFADPDAVHLLIPQHIQMQLELEEVTRKEIILADGSRKFVPYVGPVEVHFKNRVGFTGALVMGDQALLGAIPMEDMDLVILPKRKTLDVNPSSPNVATSVAKWSRTNRYFRR